MAEAAAIPSESKEKSILDELAHSETVRKLIECPVCLELPLPPIYVCNKGHIVCNSCQARTYACPLCREHYSSTRGFVAEGLIEKCILRCKYVDHGCPLSMRGSALVDHLEVCDYRPVKCIDCAGKLVNFDEYEEHLLKFHRINGIHQSRAYVIYSMNLAHQIAFGEKCCWPQYYLKAFDNVTFLLRLYATHWFVCAWISLLGPKSECSKYEALLEFHPTNDDSVVHTWQGPVNHFRDDPAKQIFLQGRGLITPMETLMQIAPVANDHAEWLYNIEILHATPKADETSDPCSDETVEASACSQEDTVEGDDVMTTNEKLPPPPESTELARADGEGDAPTVVRTPSARTTPQQTVSSTGVDSPHRRGSRIGSSPVRIMLDTPRLVGTPCCSSGMRTPRRSSTTSSAGVQATPSSSSSSTNTSAHNNSSGTNVLTSRPATLSHSSSILAAAATVASTIPTPSSLMENAQNASGPSSSSSAQSYMNAVNADRSESASGQAPVTVSTLRSSRLLNNIRRASPFSYIFRGENSVLSRAYGFGEDDWDFTSASDDE